MNENVIRFRGRQSHFRLDRRAGQLLRDPSSFINLPAKEFCLLEFFVTNPRTLFSKDELIEQVWGKDSAPGDDALARAISALRQALGDDPAAPEFIFTVHKRGYRFDGEIEADSTVTASPVRAEDGTRDSRFTALQSQADSIFALTPVQDEPRLIGRQFELWNARHQLRGPGQHVLLFGPVGVGKTSLANILAMKLARDESRAWCRTEVNDSDTFKDISRKIRKAISRELSDVRLATETDLSPSELADEFKAVARSRPFLMILDEFQRPMTASAKVGISELLKGLGDRATRAQFIVVGVAENIEDLIAGHESLVLRHLHPVPVATMTRPTTLDIVRRGFNDLASHGWPDPASSQPLEAVGNSITDLSLGLPTMVNDLARETARVALDNRSSRVTEADFKNAINRLTSRYSRELVFELRGQLAHDPYLIACAAARTDTRGYRSVDGVAAALETLTGKRIDTAHVASRLAVHLRSGVLKPGSKEGDVYFALNLLPSRLLVAAVAEGSLKLDRLAAIWRHKIDHFWTSSSTSSLNVCVWSTRAKSTGRVKPSAGPTPDSRMRTNTSGSIERIRDSRTASKRLPDACRISG